MWYDGAESEATGHRQEADRSIWPRKGKTLNLRTYQAHSLTEALTRIKTDLGEDAVVLHSRTFRRGGMLGFGGQLIYEVTASMPAPRPRPTARSAPRAAASRNNTTASTQDTDAARTAAMTLALAEQARRRQKALESVPAGSQSAAAPVRISRPGVELELSRPVPGSAPTFTQSAIPTQQSNGAARAQKTNPSPAPVAKRYVLSPPPSDAPPKPKPAPTPPRAPRPKAEDLPPETPLRARKRVAPSSPPPPAAPAASPPTRPLRRTEPALHDELATLKQMVSQVLQRQSGTLQPAMPEALFNEYVSLIQNEVAQEIADELCDTVRRELTDTELTDAASVRASFRTHLAQYVPIAPDSMLVTPTDGRPFTIALVGPTGVGKTTTVAKLAAAFKLRHNKRVGLITTDTYRIAAVDQLRTYANIIGLPLKVALSPDEMHEACQSLANCDVILIDTAGRSPNDSARLDEIRDFAKAANPHEIHLVLSSTCSEQALMRTIERFSTVQTDRVIFTKTDEAVSLGVLINVMRKAGKELSFITTGQEVPDHIEAGSPDRLAALVLGEKG